MMNKKICRVVIYVILISAGFILASILGQRIMPRNWMWFTYSSAIRVIFGGLTLWLISRTYDKKAVDILKPQNTKLALIAGLGFGLYVAYYLMILGMSFEGFYGLSVGLVVFQIFLQQFTTGFYEELLYRGLLLEGYFVSDKKR